MLTLHDLTEEFTSARIDWGLGGKTFRAPEFVPLPRAPRKSLALLFTRRLGSGSPSGSFYSQTSSPPPPSPWPGPFPTQPVFSDAGPERRGSRRGAGRRARRTRAPLLSDAAPTRPAREEERAASGRRGTGG